MEIETENKFKVLIYIHIIKYWLLKKYYEFSN